LRRGSEGSAGHCTLIDLQAKPLLVSDHPQLGPNHALLVAGAEPASAVLAGTRQWATPSQSLESFGAHTERAPRPPVHVSGEVEPDRQQIMVSRSFAGRVHDHDTVVQALTNFAVRACEKLRARGLIASGLWIYADFGTFRPGLPQNAANRTTVLPDATGDPMW